MSVGDQSATREPRGETGDHALLCQQPQRLAQRRPADAEVRAQLLLDDLLPGLQIAAQDGVAQPMPGDFDQRRGQCVSRTVMPGRSHGRQW